RLVGQIVRAVQTFAVVFVRKRRFGFAVGFEPRDAPVAMLASDQAALGIIGQTVRAGFASRERLFASVTGGLHKDALAFALLPFDDRVVRDVGEEQVSPLPV